LTPPQEGGVAPHAGAWIETISFENHGAGRIVAPHAGAWIETDESLTKAAESATVAPHAGAWIETIPRRTAKKYAAVAPHAGAWIETNITAGCFWIGKSHPTRVRGLKLSNVVAQSC